jgi:hypothetical protein
VGRFRPFALAVGLTAIVVAGALGIASWWNDPGAATKDDEHYIAIARGAPEVFRHPEGGRAITATVDRSGRLAVDFHFPSERVRVFVHPRTERVEGIARFAR